LNSWRNTERWSRISECAKIAPKIHDPKKARAIRVSAPLILATDKTKKRNPTGAKTARERKNAKPPTMLDSLVSVFGFSVSLELSSDIC
jgi:hypothetical protein